MVEQVKPEVIREWLNDLAEHPGWLLLRERIEYTMEIAMELICKKGVDVRVADYHRGVRAACEEIMELRKELFEETITSEESESAD